MLLPGSRTAHINGLNRPDELSGSPQKAQSCNLSASILHRDEPSFHRLSWSFLVFLGLRYCGGSFNHQASDHACPPSTKAPSSDCGLGPKLCCSWTVIRTRDHRQTALTPFLAERLSASPLAVPERLRGATQILPSSCCHGRTFPIPLPLATNEMNTSSASGGSLTNWALGRRYIWQG